VHPVCVQVFGRLLIGLFDVPGQPILHEIQNTGGVGRLAGSSVLLEILNLLHKLVVLLAVRSQCSILCFFEQGFFRGKVKLGVVAGCADNLLDFFRTLSRKHGFMESVDKREELFCAPHRNVQLSR